MSAAAGRTLRELRFLRASLANLPESISIFRLKVWNRRDDFLDVGEASGALVSAGEVAFFGVDEMAVVGLELGDVSLGGGMEPHFAVHGGGDEDGGFRREGEVDGGEGIGGEAVGELAQEVGGGGGDEQEVGAVGEIDVARFPGILFVFKGNENGMAGEGLEGEGSDEFAGGSGHDGVNLVAELDELGGEFGGFVGGDGSGDAEDDFHGKLKNLNFKIQGRGC